MNTIRFACRPGYPMGVLAVALLGCCVVGAQSSEKAKPAPAKAAKPPSSAAGHGASAAGHGPAAAGGTHGPSPTTAGGSHGPTTSAHGPSTAGGSAGRPGAGNKPNTVGGHDPTGRAAGGSATAASRAGKAGPQPKGSRTVSDAHGNEIRTRANGRPADVHVASRGMDIHHGLDGSRRVSVERADHSRIVADGRGRGYVQHPYSYGGHEFAHRTYYRNGRAYDRFYRGYPYHGVYVEAYAPAYYYAPAFYGWAYNPWPAPIAYSWGFAVAPWYGFYGGYFAPWPVYANASLWLTDYLISQSIAAAYLDETAAAQAAGDPPAAGPLTPAVKQEISDEVQRQIALENQEAQMTAQNTQPDPASSGIQRMLTDGVQHVFVAGSNIDVTDNGGDECTVGEGDALKLTGPPTSDATVASLVMLSSKGGHDCAQGDTVSVAFTDLQDMQNQMRETISAGMGTLQTNQGKGGLPSLPPSAQAAPVKAAFAASAPPPDTDAANQINQQVQDAGQAEQEALKGTQSAPQDASSQGATPATASGPPKTISMGQTIDEVTAAIGPPKSIVNLATKKIYVYPDLKVTFVHGKVSDVQ